MWRRAAAGIEVLLIHRPRHGDWTWPKGKAEEGESDEDCALREVEEEVGLRCTLGPELAQARYGDSEGREKVVRYWTMELPPGADPIAGDGVDELAWVDVDGAEQRLTWEHDVEVLRSLRVEALG